MSSTGGFNSSSSNSSSNSSSAVYDNVKPLLNLRIFFMRHAKSCSNMLRDNGERKRFDLDEVSQQLQDPPLSDKGKEMAELYAPTLQTILTEKGILNESTILAASELVRAQQTARILFPSVAGNDRKLYIFPYLAEEGDIPENTRRRPYKQIAELRKIATGSGDIEESKTDEYEQSDTGPRRNIRSMKQETGWELFKGWLQNDNEFRNGTMIIVGHGSYLKGVLKNLGKPNIKPNNMDGFIVTVEGTKFTLEQREGYPPDGIFRSSVVIRDPESDKCSARMTGSYTPFPLGKYTSDPAILKYKPQLDALYLKVMEESKIPSETDPANIDYFFQRTADLNSMLARYTSDPVVRAMFLKIYNAAAAQEKWPPIDYPDTAPPLYSVPGYFKESQKHFALRILTEIGKPMNLSPKKVFEALKPAIEPDPDTGMILKIKELVGIPINKDITEVYNSWVNEGTTIGKYFTLKLWPLLRFIEHIHAAATWDDFLLDLDRSEYFTEFEAGFKTNTISSTLLQQKLKDRYQQLYVIVPSNETDYTRKFRVIDKLDGVAFNETRWIRFLDENPVIPKTENIDGTVDEDSGEPRFSEAQGLYTNVMVIQGYRIRDHPDIVAALRRKRSAADANPDGPRIDAHPDVKRMFPEWWISAESRRAWLDGVDLAEKAEALPYNLDYLETIKTSADILHELDSSEFVDRYAKNPAVKDLREQLAILLVDKVSSSLNNKTKTPTTKAEKLSAYATMPQQVKDEAVKKIVVKDILKIIDNIRSKWIVNDKGVSVISNKIMSTLERLEQLSREPSIKIDAIQRRLRTWRDLYLSSPNADPALILPVTTFVLDRQPANLSDVTNAVIPILWTLKAVDLSVSTNDQKLVELIPKDLADAALRYIRAMETTEKILDKTTAENELESFKRAIQRNINLTDPKKKEFLIKAIYEKLLKKTADTNIENDEYNSLVNEEGADIIINEALFNKTHTGGIDVDGYKETQEPQENDQIVDLYDQNRRKPKNSFFGKPAASFFRSKGPPQFLTKEEAPDKPLLTVTSRPSYGRPPLAKIRPPKAIGPPQAGQPLNLDDMLDDEEDKPQRPVRPSVRPLDRSYKTTLFPAPRYVINGGAYETQDQLKDIKLAERILKIFYSSFYSPKSKQKIQPSVINPQEGEGLSNTLDVLANLADIDPTLACNKILAEQVEPYTDLKIRLGVKPKSGWFGSMKCPKADGIVSEIANYKSIKSLPDLTADIGKRIERVKTYINNPKATDKKKYEMLQKFETLVKSKLNGVPILPSVKSGWLGKTYPKNKEILSYLDSIQTMLNPLPANVPSANVPSRNESFDSEESEEEYTGPKTGPRDRTGAGKVPFLSLYGVSGGRGGSRKTSTLTRKMYRSQRRKQSGGGVTMPLGFYQDGAQMQGTYGSETGTGLGGMTSTMAREALVQTGGSTFGSRRRQRQRRETRKAQRGGFSPSIMGSFAANGLSLLPVASYMTYRMTHGPGSKKGRTRKSGPVKTGRRRQTRR